MQANNTLKAQGFKRMPITYQIGWDKCVSYHVSLTACVRRGNGLQEMNLAE